jgi:elongation factor G
LATGLARLVAEDTSLRVSFEPSTRQTVLWGGGETHLRVALARLARQGVEVETEDVKTAYHETLAGPVEIQVRHKKQTGGHGQFAVATVRLEPLDRGAGYAFESHVTGGAIPRNLIPAVGAGIEEALSDGGRYGFPVVDVRAVCLDGQHHPVDSSEMAFKTAGALALRTAVREVGTTLLEPISTVEIHIPSALQGDVLGDLSARRAQVLGTGTIDTSGTMIEVRALVPTAEIGDYAIGLRSMTGGAGVFTRSHHGYQVAPDTVASKVTASD